jgi:hypothetical protein
MADTPVWDVTLFVDGPITVKRRVTTTQQKGFRVDDPFYSDIEIVGIPSGLKATVTARAPDHAIAYKAAVFFFGHMLDTLALIVNRPMNLSLMERERSYAPRHDVMRIIERGEFESAFSEAHRLGQGSPSFLRSLGWYRKGLTTEDPLDKFLAFWNSIEIVAGKYYRFVSSIDKERAKKGCISQVWECFKALWGPCEAWPVIPGQTKWVDQSYAIRVGVAHGTESIDIHKVAEVADRIPAIEEVSYRFLLGWREKFLGLDRHPPSESLPAGERELLPE